MVLKTPNRIFAKEALTSDGWCQDVLLHIQSGIITRIETGAKPGDTTQHEVLIPGMPNLHSHAFQRVFAGLAERAGGAGDFWGWRQVMYRVANALSPEQVEAIARYLYIEMLKAGYTSVGEFHYLYHAPDGAPYANIAELSERILSAAEDTGIGLTLLPVLYATGNFGNAPAEDGQHRFLMKVSQYLKLLEVLKGKTSLGVAPHSLRAVSPEMLGELLSSLPSLGLAGAPIHIHAAEQEKEVVDSLAFSGKRPVEWLLEQGIDSRWCLIHSTHINAQETELLAKCGAVAGLCPSTEGNLGDGVFPTAEYLAAGGGFGIGSDSHITVNPFDELRLLEYYQRLKGERRNVLSGGGATGTALWSQAAAGGAKALGIKAGAIAEGRRADLVAFDVSHPLYEGKTGDALLNTAIFALTTPPVKDVYVGGARVVENGYHVVQEKAENGFKQVLKALHVAS